MRPFPRKRFAQHFLHDHGILLQMMAAINPQPADRLVEIGPGTGALTLPLLKQQTQLIAIEIDRDLVASLRKKCKAIGDLCLYQADVVRFNFATLAVPGKKLRIVGNLPYNISTPILFHLVQFSSLIQDIHILVQKEVGQRISALPGAHTYGRLSVMLQSQFITHYLFDVPPDAFDPQPKVQSTFIQLIPHVPPLTLPSRFHEIVASAFSKRRKTLRNSLKPHISPAQLIAAGIDPDRRAQTLSPEEFAHLAALINR